MLTAFIFSAFIWIEIHFFGQRLVINLVDGVLGIAASIPEGHEFRESPEIFANWRESPFLHFWHWDFRFNKPGLVGYISLFPIVLLLGLYLSWPSFNKLILYRHSNEIGAGNTDG